MSVYLDSIPIDYSNSNSYSNYSSQLRNKILSSSSDFDLFYLNSENVLPISTNGAVLNLKNSKIIMSNINNNINKNYINGTSYDNIYLVILFLYHFHKMNI